MSFDVTLAALRTWHHAPDTDGWPVLRALADDLWLGARPLGDLPFHEATEVSDEWSVFSGRLGSLPDLHGFDTSPPRLFRLPVGGMLEAPFTLLWFDIHRPEGRVLLPDATLSHARQQWVKSAQTGDDARSSSVENVVFLFTVHGEAYPVPDLVLVGPGERSNAADGRAGDSVFKLPLSREIAAHGESALRTMLERLAPLANRTAWRQIFGKQEATELRDRIRKELKKRLSEAMALLELHRGVKAPDGELKVLREAATLIAFRLMFLGEVERRGLLYEIKPDRLFAELCAAETENEGRAAGSVVGRFRELCTAMRGKPTTLSVGLRGASIFASQPTLEFDGRLADWLGPFDDPAQPVPTLLQARWDALLAGLANVVLGFLDEHQGNVDAAHRRANPVGHGVLGVGGAEHAHRMLGEVYEQVLALEPGRDKTGAPVLKLKGQGKEEGDSARAVTTERSKLGAHYTPEMLVREMVRPALGILFEQRWQESKGDLDAYRNAVQNLRVVDPAMGSGHFLTVAALEIARELAISEVVGAPTPEHFERFQQVHHEDRHAEERVSAEHRAAYQSALARRIPEVVRRTCYGVDVSPLACELGKLSLWLFTLTVQQDVKPELTFLDANIRCGNSLVGSGWTYAKPIFKDRLNFDLDGTPAAQSDMLFNEQEAGRKVGDQRKDIEALQAAMTLPTAKLRAWCSSDGKTFFVGRPLPEDGYELRKRVRETVRDLLQPVRWVYDLAVLAVWYDVKGGRADKLAKAIHTEVGLPGSPLALKQLFDKPLSTREPAVLAYRDAIPRVLAKCGFNGERLQPLHWSFEFPGVFAGSRPGFDAVLANPPFIGDRDLRGRIGQDLVEYLVAQYTTPRDGGTCDLAGFFELKYDDILARDRAVATTLAPNTLAQAKNRKTVLVPLLNGTVAGRGPAFTMTRAVQSREWPGEAAVHICVQWLARRDWSGQRRLVVRDAEDVWVTVPVERISTFLDSYRDAPNGRLDAFELPSAREGLFFTGMFLRGADGTPGDFVKGRDVAQAFLDEATRRGERKAVYAYLNNELVQNRRRPLAEEVCVDFFDVLQEAGLLDADPDAQLDWLRTHYPFCLAAIDDVRKVRQALTDSGSNREHKRSWWMYGSSRHELRRLWSQESHVVLVGRVTKVWSPSRIPRADPVLNVAICPTDQLVLMPNSSSAVFAVIATALVEAHVRRNCSSLETRLRFTPESAFPSFPFPWPSSWSTDAGRPNMVPPLAAAEVALAPVAAQLLQVREELLLNPETHLPEVHPVPRDWGPTELYNRYDDSSFQAPGIEPLRKSHRDLLDAVLRQYGWTDLADEMAAPPNLGWGFERPWIDRTERYVPVLRFREQMLERLMALNEQRYWEEIDLYVPHVVAVLPERKPAKVTKDACKEKGIVIDEDDLANVLLRAEKAGLIKRERDGAWTRVQGAKAKTGARVA